MSDKLLISTFTAMRKRFLSIAMHILPSEDDAADALQDAFCKLWPRRDDIKSSTQAEALTRTTLKNICIDKVRKRTIETIPIDEQHDVFEEESTQSYKEKQFIQVKEIIEKGLLYVKSFDRTTGTNITSPLPSRRNAVGCASTGKCTGIRSLRRKRDLRQMSCDITGARW